MVSLLIGNGDVASLKLGLMCLTADWYLPHFYRLSGSLTAFWIENENDAHLLFSCSLSRAVWFSATNLNRSGCATSSRIWSSNSASGQHHIWWQFYKQFKNSLRDIAAAEEKPVAIIISITIKLVGASCNRTFPATGGLYGRQAMTSMSSAKYGMFWMRSWAKSELLFR